MDWKKQVFNWTPTTLRDFREALGKSSKLRTDDELRAILNIVIKSQQIDLLVDLADKQIEELLKINDNKWDVIDALMDGDQDRALNLMNLMAGKLKKTLSNELLKSNQVIQESNVLQFRQRK